MSSHLLAHLVIFTAYIVACLQVPPTFRALIRLRTLTIVAGGGFFLLCGLTHLSIALGETDAPWVSVTDHAQALCIVGFLWCLSLDLRDALVRLRGTYKAIYDEFGPEVGTRLVTLIQKSLGGS